MKNLYNIFYIYILMFSKIFTQVEINKYFDWLLYTIDLLYIINIQDYKYTVLYIINRYIYKES